MKLFLPFCSRVVATPHTKCSINGELALGQHVSNHGGKHVLNLFSSFIMFSRHKTHSWFQIVNGYVCCKTWPNKAPSKQQFLLQETLQLIYGSCAYLSIYVYLFLSLYLSIYLPIRLYVSVFLSIYLSLTIYLPFSLFIYLSTYLFINLPIYLLCLYVSFFLSQYVSVPVCFCLCLSIRNSYFSYTCQYFLPMWNHISKAVIYLYSFLTGLFGITWANPWAIVRNWLFATENYIATKLKKS